MTRGILLRLFVFLILACFVGGGAYLIWTGELSDCKYAHQVGYFQIDNKYYYRGPKTACCYYRRVRVDPPSFHIIDIIYAYDKKHFYEYGRVNKKVDAKTVQVLDRPYLKDKNHVFFEGKLFPGVDVNTFETLAPYYAKDKRNVYHRENKINYADPSTFEVINLSNFGKDKNFAYFGGTKIEQSDGNTFEVINDEYSKDKRNVYHLGYFPDEFPKYKVSIVPGADPVNFEVPH